MESEVKMSGIKVAIDASRNRSGGARAHLIGILEEGVPARYNIEEVHLWTYKSLADEIPARPWLTKHTPIELEQSLIRQIWWQATRLAGAARSAGCDILFTTDASTFCRFKPMVVLSQDMLAYEPGVMRRFGFTKDRMRLEAILRLQNHAFRSADGVIFLSRHAAQEIQRKCGALSHIKRIPHGVGHEFKENRTPKKWPGSKTHPVRCLYVSPTWLFKHQWVVVRAIAALREKGHNLSLTLVGGGDGTAQRLLDKQVAISDPDREFIQLINFVPQRELPSLLADCNIFIFASSCENMPNTLLEAMATGLPIACSNRGPMPEVLSDGGVYFDPENADSIAAAVEKIIEDPNARLKAARRAKRLSEGYSWSRCADETWDFMSETYRRINSAKISGDETCVESWL